jgi:hypothetical protein
MARGILDAVYGSVVGGAIGDALGAPVEGWYYTEIRERFGRVTEFVDTQRGCGWKPAITGGSGSTSGSPCGKRCWIGSWVGRHVREVCCVLRAFSRFLAPTLRVGAGGGRSASNGGSAGLLTRSVRAAFPRGGAETRKASGGTT